MKKMYLFKVLLIYAVHTQAQSVAPSTVNVCGGFYNAGYYQFEWSVGEMAIVETLGNTTNGYTVNGVLQPLTNRVSSFLIDNKWADNEIKIFPSPTNGKFEVNIMTKQQGILEIQLINSLGTVISRYSNNYFGFGYIHRFDISKNASANYFLRVNLSPNPGFFEKKGAFKILKIN